MPSSDLRTVGRSSLAALGLFWTDVNGITDAPLETTTNDGGTSVETLRYTGGTNGTEVLHHRVVGGGHVWFDLEVNETPTNQMLWQFLSRFELDGALQLTLSAVVGCPRNPLVTRWFPDPL